MKITLNYVKSVLSSKPAPNNPFHLPSDRSYYDLWLDLEWPDINDCALQYARIELRYLGLHEDPNGIKDTLVQKLIDRGRLFIIDPLTGEILSWKDLGIDLPDRV